MYKEFLTYRKFCHKVLRRVGISKINIGEDILDVNFMIEEDGCVTVNYIISGKKLSNLISVKKLRQTIINMCKFKFVRPVTKGDRVGYAFGGIPIPLIMYDI